jgi:hypothetical protein
MTAEESADLCTRLDDYLDLIELSGGSYESMSTAWGYSHNKKASTQKREAFFIEVSSALGTVDFGSCIEELTSSSLSTHSSLITSDLASRTPSFASLVVSVRSTR